MAIIGKPLTFKERIGQGAAGERGVRARLLRALASDDKLLASVEADVRKRRGLAPNAAVDWSKIPWAEILAALLPILLKVLV